MARLSRKSLFWSFLFGVASVSGNNFILQVSSLCVMFLAYSKNVRFRYIAVTTFVLVIGTISLFAVFLASNASSNALRLFQLTCYVYLIGHTCKEFGKFQVSDKYLIIQLLLYIFFFFSFLQFTGILGPSLDAYHHFVGNDLPTNLSREASLGFVGYRMHGIFSEPSYFGTFVGLFLYAKYAIDKNFLVFAIACLAAFILCPTPNIFLSVISMFAIGAIATTRFATIKFLIYVLILMAASLYWFREHLVAYYQAFSALEYTNTSLSLRILNPLITLFKFVGSGDLFWVADCNIRQESFCDVSALKLPIISMLIFFSYFYLIFFIVFSAKWFRTRLIKTIFILFVSSLLSGGGIYSVQFYFIFSLMHVLGNYERRIL